MKTQFKHLKRWELPPSYFGANWPDWYVFLSRNRDSSELSESNFETGLSAVRAVASKEPIPDEIGDETDMATVQVVRESHWAVGWVEWIAIHKSDTAALIEADRLLSRLESYPVLDEEDWSRREDESAQQIWRECYNASERIKYIREHRSQFEFQTVADLIGCVRGKYFAGYASELLN